jgi:hypothetical protein
MAAHARARPEPKERLHGHLCGFVAMVSPRWLLGGSRAENFPAKRLIYLAPRAGIRDPKQINGLERLPGTKAHIDTERLSAPLANLSRPPPDYESESPGARIAVTARPTRSLYAAKACPTWPLRFGHKPTDEIVADQWNTLLRPLEWRMTAPRSQRALWLHEPLVVLREAANESAHDSSEGREFARRSR